MSTIDFSAVLTADDPEPPYLVEGMYFRGQMIVMAGEAGVGKSFLQYTLAMSLACDLPFLGRKVVPGKVLYFDEENSRHDLHQYLRRIWRGLSCPSIDTVQENLIIEHFALLSEGKNRYEYMAKQASSAKPALIVIDTASPVCDIADEQSNTEAKDAVKNLRRVKESAGPDCALVILKHTLLSHDPARAMTIRGAKAWLDMCDNIIYHTLLPGKKRADGLRNCRLFSGKQRSYGLDHDTVIVPQWCGEGDAKGVTLIPRA